MSRDTPFALACELPRLWFDHRTPQLFDDAKRELAAGFPGQLDLFVK